VVATEVQLRRQGEAAVVGDLSRHGIGGRPRQARPSTTSDRPGRGSERSPQSREARAGCVSLAWRFASRRDQGTSAASGHAAHRSARSDRNGSSCTASLWPGVPICHRDRTRRTRSDARPAWRSETDARAAHGRDHRSQASRPLASGNRELQGHADHARRAASRSSRVRPLFSSNGATRCSIRANRVVRAHTPKLTGRLPERAHAIRQRIHATAARHCLRSTTSGPCSSQRAAWRARPAGAR
jgi:hypothetical protein